MVMVQGARVRLGISVGVPGWVKGAFEGRGRGGGGFDESTGPGVGGGVGAVGERLNVIWFDL